MFDAHELKIRTNRELVSLMAKVYYPLGLLSPLTVLSKILVQELWKGQYGWDDVTRIRSDKMEKVPSRRGSAETGRTSSMLFLLIARSNGERNPCLLRCLTERLC